jgi:hypothetical protein
VIPSPESWYAVDFSDGLAVVHVKTNDKVSAGYVNTKGELVIELKFEDARDFADGLAPVKTKAGWGYVNKTGAFAIGPAFDNAHEFHSGLARVNVGGKDAYIDKTGHFVWTASN